MSAPITHPYLPTVTFSEDANLETVYSVLTGWTVTVRTLGGTHSGVTGVVLFVDHDYWLCDNDDESKRIIRLDENVTHVVVL